MPFLRRIIAGEKKATTILTICLGLVLAVTTVPLIVEMCFKVPNAKRNESDNGSNFREIRNNSASRCAESQRKTVSLACQKELKNESENETTGLCLRAVCCLPECYPPSEGVSQTKRKESNHGSGSQFVYSILKEKVKGKCFRVSCNETRKDCSCYASAWEHSTSGALLTACIWFSTAFIPISTLVILFTWQGTVKLHNYPPNGFQMMTLGYLLMGVVVILPQMIGRAKFFCSYENAKLADEHPTLACTISGAINHFSEVFFTTWWLCSICEVYSTVSSFTRHSFRTPRKSTIVFFARFLLSLAIGSSPVAATFAGGSYIGTTSNIICRQNGSGNFFRTTVIPITALTYGGIAITVGIIYKLRNCDTLKSYVANEEDGSRTLIQAYDALQHRFVFHIFVVPLITSTITSTFSIMITMHKREPSCYSANSTNSNQRFTLSLAAFDLFLFDLLGLALALHCLASSPSRKYWSSVRRRLWRKLLFRPKQPTGYSRQTVEATTYGTIDKTKICM
ncbi:uncharacterized protein [Oscarella lobularis]|uniref:uncharacterized protein isoform X2 n=1 Tax=Oscarella lobularis TaxID=121494 RepID=UPI0033137E20